MTALRSRAVRFSAAPRAHRRLLRALGATVADETTSSVLYRLDSGDVRVMVVAANDDRVGSTRLAFLTDGTGRRVEAPDGVAFDVVRASREPSIGPGLSVMPIWYTTDPGYATRTLEDLGAERRITADNGVWFDFRCSAGGFVAVHAAQSSGIELGFEYEGDLDAFTAHLREQGVEATIVDEAYTRVIHVPDPDGGPAWQINHRQEDLYGFTVEDS